MKSPVSRRKYIQSLTTVPLVIGSAGCTSSHEENLIHSAEIEETTRTGSELILDVLVTTKYSCAKSSAPDEAIIDIVVRIDGDERHRDTWEAKIVGCMNESSTGRRYRLQVEDYTQATVETETVSLVTNTPTPRTEE